MEGMQFTLVGDDGSGGSTFALQTVATGDDGIAQVGNYLEMTQSDHTVMSNVQEMSGIETLSRVAARQFADTKVPGNSETNPDSTIKVEENEQVHNEGTDAENVNFSFYCQNCGEAYEELEDLEQHLHDEHGAIDTEGEAGQEDELSLFPTCQLCSQTFADTQQLEKHEKEHVCMSETDQQLSRDTNPKQCNLENNATFKCKFCSIFFVDRHKLHQHVKQLHQSENSERCDKTNMFKKCPYCHKLYVQRGNNKAMMNHIYSAHPGKSVEIEKSAVEVTEMDCPICGLEFVWQKSLIRHMKDRHPKLMAEKEEQILSELGIPYVKSPGKRHRRSIKDVCEDLELICCPSCPRKFIWEKSLKRHMQDIHNGDPLLVRVKKSPVVFCCPHCNLVSKYACAIRKHLERKHSEIVKGLDILKLPLPTKDATAVMDIELKTVDKRPAEIRLNLCPFIYRCPFCIYAAKLRSNLIRHLTSVKHGNIFSHEEIAEIGIDWFKVKQNIMNVNHIEKIDGTSCKTLPKLNLKGKILEIVMTKYEILKQRKLENKENGLDEASYDKDYTVIDVESIIELAEYESEESFDEDEIEIIDASQEIDTREIRQGQRNHDIEMNETDDNDGVGYSDVSDIIDENENTDFVDNTSDTKKDITIKTNENQDKISLSKKELKGIEGKKRNNIPTRQYQEIMDICPDNDMELDSTTENKIEVDAFMISDTTEMNISENLRGAKNKMTTKTNDMKRELSLLKKEEVNEIKSRKRYINKRRDTRQDHRKKDIIHENEIELESTIEHESLDIEVDTSEMNKASVLAENTYNKKVCLSKQKKLNETNCRKKDGYKTTVANEKSDEIVVSLRNRSKHSKKDNEQGNVELKETSRKKVMKKCTTSKNSDEIAACLSSRSKPAVTDFEQSLCGMDTHKDSVVCEVCRKEFSNFTELKLHLSAHINMKLSFRCLECGLQDLAFFNDMKTHMNDEHNIDYSELDLACLYMSVVKMNLKPVTTYDCPYCEMLFSQSSPLQQHVIMDHSECIQSAFIKQEYGITRERRISNTIISAYNCQYCECFYHNITDIVKHMHVMHKDVDRSSKTVADSCVRKSSRKRKMPKWLEEETGAVSTKKSKQNKKLESDTCTSLKSSIAETAAVSKRKETEPESLPIQANGTAKFRKKKVENDVAENVLNCANTMTSNTEKCQLDRIERETLKTHGKDNALRISNSNRLSKTNSDQNKSKSSKKIQQDKSKRTTEIGLVCLKDQTESKNRCPHCDFVAKRSSALAFHVQFKHADIKIKEESVDSENEVQNERAASVSPCKASTSADSTISVHARSRKSGIHENGGALPNPAVELVNSKKRIKDIAIVETSIKSIKDTLKVKEQKVPQSVCLANTKICENEAAETIYGLEQNFVNNDKDDDGFHEEDLEYGDSDDDYKPESDTDDDSDLEKLDEDDNVGYPISVKLECPYCQSGLFSSLPLLEQHVEKKHPKEVNSFSISNAKTKVELDGMVKSSNLVHTCNYCRKTFLSKAHVRAHVRNKHRQKLAAKFKRKLEKLSRNGEEPSMNDSECKELYKCKFCTTVLDSSGQVLSHIKKQHPLKKDVHPNDIERYERQDEDTIHNVYICPYCETRSKWKRCISRHITHSHAQVTEYEAEIIHEREIIKHKSQNLYQCVYCSWQYEHKVDVLSHIAEAHSDQPSVTEDDLFEVEIADTVEDSFQCPFCDLKSKYKRCVIRHVSRTHKNRKGFAKSDVICLSTKKSRKSANEGLVYMCLFCDGESRWKDRIVRHVEIQHPDIEDFNPETIPSEYRTLSILSLDDEGVLDNEEDIDFENYKCTYCDAISDTKEGVLQHTLDNHPKKTIELHKVEKAIWNEVHPSGDLVYKCPVCDSGSKWKRTIVRHVKTTHPELKKFQVELCKADLTLNASDSMHVCRLCNELFMSIRAADAHSLHVHGNGEKAVIESVSNPHKLVNVFRCVYCDHSSGLRNAVVTHVAAQHPEVKDFEAKNVICEIVPETQPSGIGGYLCPYCDTVNHWKKSIVRHIRTMHPKERNDIEIPFNANVSMKSAGRSARKSSKQINCLICRTSCRSMEKMRKHFLNKHPKLAKNFLDKKNTEFSYESTDGKPLDHVCVLCSAKYMWKKSLLVHMKSRHGDMFQVYQALDHVVDIAASAAGM